MDIIEKLRQERIERARQRQAELDKMEADLQAKREARKAERGALRDKERKTTAAAEVLTAKNIKDSLKIAEVGKAKEEDKMKDLEMKQKTAQSKRDTDVEIWLERRKRMQELVKRRKALRIPPRPKRYIVQPAEFYGLDFTISSHISMQQRQDELLDLFRKREEELLQDPEKMASLIKAGNAIVKGLHDVAKMDRNKVQDFVKKNKKQQEDGKLGPDAGDKKAKTKGESVDDFLASLNDLTTPITAEEEGARLKAQKRKKWMEGLPRAKVDYSDYFAPDVGMKEGVTVWRIEELKPVPLHKGARIGRFCLGDCYLVLHNSVRPDGATESRVYQWIGEKAALDKKACSAIFGVALRDILQTEFEVSREESHHETKEFMNVFLMYDYDFGYEDADKATASGLFSVEEKDYPLLMYKVFSQRKRRRAEKDQGDKKSMLSGETGFYLVEPVYTSLRSRNVFLIDSGLIVFQWNGQDSTLADRCKARMLAERILRYERPQSKTKFLEFHEGAEPEALWKVLEGRREGMTEAEIEEDDVPDENPNIQLYVFDKAIERKPASAIEPKHVLKFPAEKLKGPMPSMLSTQSCAVLDTGSEVFLWTGKKSSPRIRAIAEALLINKIFPSRERPEFVFRAKFMEGVESEAFKARFDGWSRDLIRKIDYRIEDPSKEEEANEPLVKVDITALFTAPPTGRNTKDEEDFFEGLFGKANTLLQSLQTFIYDQRVKKFVRVPEWTHEKTGRERGQFYSEETYIFLCVYRKQMAQEEQEIEDKLKGDENDKNDEEDAPPPQYECVTYLWSGRNVPKPSFALLTFQHQFKKTIDDLIKKMSDGKMELRIVHLNQEKESLAMLAHLDREYIIHAGKRPRKLPEFVPKPREDKTYCVPEKLNKGQIRMYHIRHDPKYKVTRAVQLTPMLTSFCTRDCYLIFYAGENGTDPHTQENTFLWIGKGASKEEERYAHRICQRLIDFRMDPTEVKKPASSKYNGKLSLSAYTADPVHDAYQLVKEKTEPKEFWRVVAPAFQKPVNFMAVPYGQGFYYSLPPPRMFRCSTDSGYFRVDDLGFQYCVGDLHPESVCLLDSGPTLGKPHIVYAWLGRDVSDVVIKLAKKAVDSYFDHMNDGRSLDRSEWDSSERNKKKSATEEKHLKSGALRMDMVVVKDGQEPADFRVFFLGWGDTYRVEGATEAEIETWSRGALPLSKRSEEPQNQFLREEKERKRLLRLKRQQQHALEQKDQQQQITVTSTESLAPIASHTQHQQP